MTREEVIKALIKERKTALHENKQAFDMAIKALEQQPSEDCVSRRAVLDTKVLIELPDGQSFYCISPEDVEELPSVTPTRKKGKWIDGHCSECGCDVPAYMDDWKWIKDMDAKFCPNCGAEMESEE